MSEYVVRITPSVKGSSVHVEVRRYVGIFRPDQTGLIDEAWRWWGGEKRARKWARSVIAYDQARRAIKPLILNEDTV